MDETTSVLPNGWMLVKISRVIDKISLTGKKLKKRDYQDEGKLPVVDQGQTFVGGYTNREKLMVTCEEPVIVFGDHTKVIKYVDFDFVAGADGVKVMRPLRVFYPKLFYYFLQSVRIPKKGYARHFQFLEKSFIPLPPLPEQRRIVAQIEELFTKLDAGIEALKKIKTQLKRYRQAVLKYAFEGKLTEEWRLPAGRQEKNGVEIVVKNFSGKPIPKYKKHFVYVLECQDKSLYKGYTTDLQKRIKEHIEGAGSEWTKIHCPIALIHFEEFADEKEAIEKEHYFKSGIGRERLKELQEQKKLEYDIKAVLENIKQERKNQLGKKYKELPPVDTTELPELPEEWKWTRVGMIGEMIQYGTSEKANKDTSGIPVLRMGNIQDGRLIFDSLKYFPKNWAALKDFILEDGDILFNRTNSFELVGKTAVYKNHFPKAVFASYLIRVKVYKNTYIPDMLSFYINSHYGRQYIASVVSQQVGQANVNGRKLSLMPIPLLSFNEQLKIVDEIEQRFSIADKIEKTVEQSLKQAERLRQSILKKAFEGKLVPPVCRQAGKDPYEIPPAEEGKYFVYVFKCDDGSLYKGFTTDLLKRWLEHATGKGADWTKQHKPLYLLHWEKVNSLEEAVEREKYLKSGVGREWLKEEEKKGTLNQVLEPANILLVRIKVEKAKFEKEKLPKKKWKRKMKKRPVCRQAEGSSNV